MEPIIEKLTEIETATSRIMESAVNETRIQDQASEKRMAEFDRHVEQVTQEKLAQLHDNLQKQAEKELADLKADMEHQMNSMDSYFRDYHQEIADKIYKNIIRM